MWQHFYCLFMCIPSVINISHRSSSAVHSLTVSLLICSFMHIDQTQEIPGAAHFLILALSPGIVCPFLSAMLGLSSVKPELKVHLFSIYLQLCLDPSLSVCVDKYDVGEFLNELGLWVYTHRLPMLQLTCYICSLWICCCGWLSVCIVGLLLML